MGTEDLAYLAGLFDGEGSISITLKAENGRKTWRMRKNLTITNTNKAVLEWVKLLMGYGSIYKREHKERDWRIGYDWSIQNTRDILDFISKILPYSKIKADELNLATELLNSRESGLSIDYHAPVTDYEYFLTECLNVCKGGIINWEQVQV